MAARIFGLTGGIGSGKSTVAELLRQRGLSVVSADQLARLAVARGSSGLAEVEAQFGRGVLERDGTLNRSALGQLVFENAAHRAKLNSILHPKIQSLAQAAFAEAEQAGASLICYDAPLLFETGAFARYSPIVVVTAPREERLRRVVSRDGLTEAEFQRRDGSQLPLEQKVERADVVLDNSQSLAELEAQVEGLLDRLRGLS